MFRKSKRVSEAVRPVIESLQPRMLLSGEDVLQPVPPLPLPPGFENVDLNRRISMPEGASASTGGIVIEGTCATVYGTDGDDTIVVMPGDANGELRISGVAGVPDGTVISGIRCVGIRGGNGNDHIVADVGQVPNGEILGDDGDDVLIATGSISQITGGRGNDLIKGSTGYQRLEGGPGNDTIDGGGNDFLFVGSIYPEWLARQLGEDCLTSGVVVRMDLGTIPNDGFGGQDVIANIGSICVMSYFDDVVYGDDNANDIVCYDGSDTIYGGGGNDKIGINRGAGLVSGGAGDDTVGAGSPDVILDGGAGRNTYMYGWPGQEWVTTVSGESDGTTPSEPTAPIPTGHAPESRTVEGQVGIDLTLYGTDQDDVITIEAGEAPGQIVVSGVAGVVDGTVFENIDCLSVYAGAGNDIVVVEMASVDSIWPTIYGEEGDDLLIAKTAAELSGGAGNDTLIGSEGDDKFWPDRGNDVIRGGAGMDMLYISNTSAYYVVAGAVGEENAPATSRVIVRLDQGTVPMDGFGGHDTISGIEGVSVSCPYDDEIYGDAGDNLIIVSGGNDSVYAGAGNDVLIGLMGAHHLFGEEGNDVFSASDSFNPHIIDGGPGYDVIRDSWDIPGVFWHNPDQETDVPVPGDEDLGPAPVPPVAPDAAWAAPKKRVAEAKTARKAHVASKSKAAKLKAARLKAAKLKARQAKLGKLIRE